MRRLAEVLESAAAAAGWAALLLGLAVMALTTPVYTTALVQALDIPRSAGLPVSDAVGLANDVREFVTSSEAPDLPSTWRGTPAFDASAVSHLEDVRAVLSAARLATGVAAGALALWLGLSVAWRRWRALWAGMRAGAWLTAAVVVAGGALAATDFESFFARFHGLFFRAGTWTFPYDSLLIRLFPERFWVLSGVAWGLLTATGAVALLLTSGRVPGAVRWRAGITEETSGMNRA